MIFPKTMTDEQLEAALAANDAILNKPGPPGYVERKRLWEEAQECREELARRKGAV